MMIILQRPNHFLRWYGMVTGLVVFAATVWVFYEIFGSTTSGLIVGGVLFFVVWILLVVFHFPFAVRLGVDSARGVILIDSKEFAFNDVLSVEAKVRPARGGATTVQVEHLLRVAGYENPILLSPAKAKPQMDRTQLTAYQQLLTQLDLGPHNPVIRREQHANAESYGAESDQWHPLDAEMNRGMALAQLRGLLADPTFDGGLAREGAWADSVEQAMDNVHPHYRTDFPEVFQDGDPAVVSDAGRDAADRQHQMATDATLEQHRSVVGDLDQQIRQRTARLGKTRRILAWALAAAIVLVGTILLLSVLEVLPDAAEDAVNAALGATLLLAVILAVVHSLVYDLHIRAIRREGDQLITPSSDAARSIAALAQHWWGLYEADKDPEWSTAGANAAVDPRDPEWNSEEVVAGSGSVPDVLAQAWFANPRRSLLVLAFCLGVVGFVFFVIGIETQHWAWYIGTGVLVIAAIVTWARTDRNKAPKRHDLKEFAHRLDTLRRTNGTQARPLT